MKEIGRGNFGVVSSGKWRDTDVAVKVFIVMMMIDDDDDDDDI